MFFFAVLVSFLLKPLVWPSDPTDFASPSASLHEVYGHSTIRSLQARLLEFAEAMFGKHTHKMKIRHFNPRDRGAHGPLIGSGIHSSSPNPVPALAFFLLYFNANGPNIRIFQNTGSNYLPIPACAGAWWNNLWKPCTGPGHWWERGTWQVFCII